MKDGDPIIYRLISPEKRIMEISGPTLCMFLAATIRRGNGKKSLWIDLTGLPAYLRDWIWIYGGVRNTMDGESVIVEIEKFEEFIRVNPGAQRFSSGDAEAYESALDEISNMFFENQTQ